MDRLDTDQREALKNLILIASFGLSPDWPRGKKFALGLGLASVLLTWPRKCATNANNIGCIHSISWLYHCNIHYKDVVKHSNVGQKNQLCVVGIIAMCSYSEIYTCGRPRTRPCPRPFGLV